MIWIMKYFLEKYCLSAGLKADKDWPSSGWTPWPCVSVCTNIRGVSVRGSQTNRALLFTRKYRNF